MGCTLKAIVTDVVAGVTYRGLRASEMSIVQELYAEMSGAGRLPMHLRWVYRVLGKKMVVVAVKNCGTSEKVIGVDMFYFNARDIRDRTIHEGFIGVAAEWRGNGIATTLRRCAIRSFRDGRIAGISSRIDVGNIPSLNSARRTGFRPVERYRDPDLGVDRYYLVNHFEPLQITAP
jgi:RimJ/RimL family protein N-acetyltransferase